MELNLNSSLKKSAYLRKKLTSARNRAKYVCQIHVYFPYIEFSNEKQSSKIVIYYPVVGEKLLAKSSQSSQVKP